MIYTDFQNILIIKGNGKQNPEESYTNKYQKHIACSYGYKLVCNEDKFSKPFKTHLGKEAVYNFVYNMIEENKYCSDVIKKHFNQELVMSKEDHEDFRSSTKCWTCDNSYVVLMMMLKYEIIVISLE